MRSIRQFTSTLGRLGARSYLIHIQDQSEIVLSLQCNRFRPEWQQRKSFSPHSPSYIPMTNEQSLGVYWTRAIRKVAEQLSSNITKDSDAISVHFDNGFEKLNRSKYLIEWYIAELKKKSYFPRRGTWGSCAGANAAENEFLFSFDLVWIPRRIRRELRNATTITGKIATSGESSWVHGMHRLANTHVRSKKWVWCLCDNPIAFQNHVAQEWAYVCISVYVRLRF